MVCALLRASKGALQKTETNRFNRLAQRMEINYYFSNFIPSINARKILAGIYFLE